MVRLCRLPLMILCVYVLCVGTTAFADAKSDFLSSNPNAGGWEVGFLDDDGDFVAYNTTFDDGQGIAGWCINNCPGPKGDVTINYTDRPIDRYGVHWEPGEVCVHTPLRGGGVVVKWTASDSATMAVDTKFTTQAYGVDAKVELWAGETKLLDEKVTSNTADKTSEVSTLSVETGKRSVLKNRRIRR